jgi:hypothetical protein
MSVVNDVKGAEVMMGINDAAASDGGGIITARGRWMLSLSGVVLPYPGGRFPVI